ncbi:hypothetical protein [Candidatus Protochlamydia phocaeensis]|uniref:hypothetical protein n=1 Tax=Candidatus Protochlamydia phocaeensis TaxID=1414722 RepID=UPI0008397C02|nr:hypothetical protein [Candidatus Protochlamydia phocaeensis]
MRKLLHFLMVAICLFAMEGHLFADEDEDLIEYYHDEPDYLADELSGMLPYGINEGDLDKDPLSAQHPDVVDWVVGAASGKVEYILYLRPGGALGNQLRKFWNAVKDKHLKNEAVDKYPPHCSLTGFFPGKMSQEDDYKEDLNQALQGRGPINLKITSTAVSQGPKLDYIPLQSSDLLSITMAFVNLLQLPQEFLDTHPEFIKGLPGHFGYHISLRENTNAKTTTQVRKLENQYINLSTPNLAQNTTWSLYIYRRINGGALDEVTRVPITVQ